MRLITPSAPGIGGAWTRKLQEEPEKSEDEQEIGDVRIGKRANRRFQPAVCLGEKREVRCNDVAGRTRLEQEGKMKHVATPG